MEQPLSGDNSYFVVSQELITLIVWLIEHEQESLKKLIVRALRHGLAAELQKKESSKELPINQEELQQQIVDFFALLETLIYETTSENEVEHALQRSMIPAIQHIDSKLCDTQAMELSIEKATKAAKKRTENPKEVFCRELLRRWKPLKKQQLH
jgi:hypothetical protein